jgi:16S rRNA (guanine527-N7)-methyltransferase
MPMSPNVEKYFANVSRETIYKLDKFVQLVMKWNQSINLISADDEALIWERHILDCYCFAKYIVEQKTVVDIGSGGGFPAIIIALCTNNYVTMVESDRRKAIFLNEVTRQLELKNVKVINERCEKILPICADIITARACAPLKVFLDIASSHLSKNGEIWLLKGKSIKDEIILANDWVFDYQLYESECSDGYIINIKNLSRKTI